jgi:hypothetical protein
MSCMSIETGYINRSFLATAYFKWLLEDRSIDTILVQFAIKLGLIEPIQHNIRKT